MNNILSVLGQYFANNNYSNSAMAQARAMTGNTNAQVAISNRLTESQAHVASINAYWNIPGLMAYNSRPETLEETNIKLIDKWLAMEITDEELKDKIRV